MGKTFKQLAREKQIAKPESPRVRVTELLNFVKTQSLRELMEGLRLEINALNQAHNLYSDGLGPLVQKLQDPETSPGELPEALRAFDAYDELVSQRNKVFEKLTLLKKMAAEIGGLIEGVREECREVNPIVRLGQEFGWLATIPGVTSNLDLQYGELMQRARMIEGARGKFSLTKRNSIADETTEPEVKPEPAPADQETPAESEPKTEEGGKKKEAVESKMPETLPEKILDALAEEIEAPEKPMPWSMMDEGFGGIRKRPLIATIAEPPTPKVGHAVRKSEQGADPERKIPERKNN